MWASGSVSSSSRARAAAPLAFDEGRLRRHVVIGDKAIAVGDARIGPGKGRVDLDRLGKAFESPLDALRRPLVPEIATLQIEIVGFRVVRGPLEEGGLLVPQELDPEPVDDGQCDLVLDGEDVLESPIEFLRPEMVAGGDVEELGRDAELVLDLADTALEHRGHAQAAPDLTDVHGLELDRKGRALGRHLEVADLGQGGDNLLGQALAEIFLVFLGAEVCEGQDGDSVQDPGASGRQPRRRRLGPGRSKIREPLGDPVELGGKVLDPLIAGRGVLLQAFRDDPAQTTRRLTVQVAGVRRLGALVLHGDAQRRLTLEGHPPRRHLEQDDAEGVDVGPLIDVRPFDLLGSHILGRPDEGATVGEALGLGGAGDAEIHDPGASLAIDHDVGRLEVPMDNSQPVGFRKAVADLSGDRQGPGRGKRTHHLDDALEIVARDELHGDVIDPLAVPQVEDATDVLMGDPPGQLELIAEALDHLLVGAERGPEDLEGDGLADLSVQGLVDPAHAAAAELIEDPVPPGELGPRDDLPANDMGRHGRGTRRRQGRRHRRGGGCRGARAGAEECGTVAAKAGISLILELAMRTPHGLPLPGRARAVPLFGAGHASAGK